MAAIFHAIPHPHPVTPIAIPHPIPLHTCRMLAMIPSDLQDDPDVAGELKQKRQEHLAMWQERLDNP